MKLCLVKTSSMGDVIHTLPALTDAKHAIPDLEIDWVVEKAFMEIPYWHSTVRNVIPLEIRRWRKQLLKPATWQEWSAYKQQLQCREYDAVIDAQGLLKSAVLATRLARGRKYGYDRYSAREGVSSLFYDERFAISLQQHAVERIRRLFAQSLGYPQPMQTGDYGIAHHFAKQSINQTAYHPYIVAVHSTTRSDKHWQESCWQRLFEYVIDTGITIKLPWGNATEQERAIRLAEHHPLIKVLPRLSLTELAQEIATAQAVISVDTGLSHLAAALDKPNIVLYGATDPKLIGAYGKNQVHIQAQAMSCISPEQVWRHLRQILSLDITA